MALERHRTADDDAAAELGELEAAQKVLAADRQELRERTTALLTERAAAEREHADLEARHRELTGRVAELAADERLRALGDGELVDPVAEARDLGDALAHATARTQRRRVELAVDGAEDERALAALAATQLLPGNLDLAHACDVLEQAGIAAVTGWRYLADAVPAEHPGRGAAGGAGAGVGAAGARSGRAAGRAGGPAGGGAAAALGRPRGHHRAAGGAPGRSPTATVSSCRRRPR